MGRLAGLEADAEATEADLRERGPATEGRERRSAAERRRMIVEAALQIFAEY